MSESAQIIEPVQTERPNASNNVLEKAWERAKPVLKTVAGGALITASTYLTSTALGGLGTDFFISKAAEAGLTGILVTNAAILGAGGVALAREPVKNAFEYFKSKPWEKNK